MGDGACTADASLTVRVTIGPILLAGAGCQEASLSAPWPELPWTPPAPICYSRTDMCFRTSFQQMCLLERGFAGILLYRQQSHGIIE